MKALREVPYSDMDILAEYMDDCLREHVEFRGSPLYPGEISPGVYQAGNKFRVRFKKRVFCGGLEMTVREFLNSFVSRFATIRVVHFPETDTAVEVLYAGTAKLDEVPDDVRERIVSSIVAVSYDLYIAVYKEDEQ